MANEIWQEEEKKFLMAIAGVKIPDSTLSEVSRIVPKKLTDIDEIPESGGCYWIWTNEPVLHSLHRNRMPVPFDGGEIIYNGIAKDNVRARVRHHLYGHVDAGWSGISMDIYPGETWSHRKKVFSVKGKVPYVKAKKIVLRGNKKKELSKGDEIEIYKPIRTKEDYLNIYLSDLEKALIAKGKPLHFRNGIDISEAKHSAFEFRVYFISGLSSLYLDFIEKKWREENGLPKLCSYSSGR